MKPNSSQPANQDAVLGGQVSSPLNGLVLGGLEGVKQRLINKDVKTKILALEQALLYGEAGLDLVIQSLKEESYDVAIASYKLLQKRNEKKAKQALQESHLFLASEAGIDYSNLSKLLMAGDWKEADSETARIMLRIAQENYHLKVEDIEKFPYKDLQSIDKLWLKASNARFGFSVQKYIYFTLGGTKTYNPKIWQEFGSKVGWKKRGLWLYQWDIDFSITAPLGGLPRCYNNSNYYYIWGGCNGMGLIPLAWGGQMGGEWLSALAYRLQECGI
jgi:hypothetical protein